MKRDPGFRKEDRILVLALLVFMLYYSAIIIARSPAGGLSDYFYNQRLILPLFLFFFGLYSIDTKARLISYAKFIAVCALIGTVLSFAQSLNGKLPLFDSEFFTMGYGITQLQYSAGAVNRTILPVIHLIEAIFLMLILTYFLTKKKKTALVCSPVTSSNNSFVHEESLVVIVVCSVFGYFVIGI